tara:strand:- start:361 stop:561 length:201 start_codon:yes stop_codon:yes gene_type:complete
MKEFLEGLEKLLADNPDILIASSYSNGKVVFIDTSRNDQNIESKGRLVCSASVYRLNRELEARHER